MVKIQIPQHHDHHTLTREVGAKGGGRGCWDGNGESHYSLPAFGNFLVQFWQFFQIHFSLLTVASP